MEFMILVEYIIPIIPIIAVLGGFLFLWAIGVIFLGEMMGFWDGLEDDNTFREAVGVSGEDCSRCGKENSVREPGRGYENEIKGEEERLRICHECFKKIVRGEMENKPEYDGGEILILGKKSEKRRNQFREKCNEKRRRRRR